VTLTTDLDLAKYGVALVEWSIADHQVAIIDAATGVISAGAGGETSVTAKVTYGSVGTCQNTVYATLSLFCPGPVPVPVASCSSCFSCSSCERDPVSSGRRHEIRPIPSDCPRHLRPSAEPPFSGSNPDGASTPTPEQARMTGIP